MFNDFIHAWRVACTKGIMLSQSCCERIESVNKKALEELLAITIDKFKQIMIAAKIRGWEMNYNRALVEEIFNTNELYVTRRDALRERRGSKLFCAWIAAIEEFI